MLEFTVSEDEGGLRLDKFLRVKLPTVPVSHLFKMVRTKKIKRNGKRTKPDEALCAGDCISVWGDAQKLLPGPRQAPRPVVFDPDAVRILLEDDYLIVVDKPSGMAVHPGSGITGATVVDWVRSYLGPRAVRNDFAASPAHRLDRETSGVLVVAKRRPAMVHFTDVFTHHRARKTYQVLVKGRLSQRRGLIDVALAEHQQTARSKAERGVNYQEARTRYQVRSQWEDCALVSCTIETGRTHQIRRHFAALGHPVLGDKKYGDFEFNRRMGVSLGLRRLFLHAEELIFPHPKSGEQVQVRAELPEALTQVLGRLGPVAEAGRTARRDD